MIGGKRRLSVLVFVRFQLLCGMLVIVLPMIASMFVRVRTVLVRMSMPVDMAMHMSVFMSMSYAVTMGVLMSMGVGVFVLMAVLVLMFSFHVITSRAKMSIQRRLVRKGSNSSINRNVPPFFVYSYHSADHSSPAIPAI